MRLWKSSPVFALALLVSSTLSAHAEPAVRTALVIGNARYESEVGPLRNTLHHAEAVAKALKALGFSVIEKTNVTRDDLLKAMIKFRESLKGAEVALFYYAGHGISVRGSNYLIPLKSGYRPEGLDSTTLRMLAETRLFNVEQAVADMCSGGARCNLVILDACRSTAIARTEATRDAAAPGGLSEMTPPAGSLIAFATDAGKTALDGDGRHGIYTGELLRHMQTPGLTLEQVFKKTRAGVLNRTDGRQIPAEYSRLIGDDIYLAGVEPSDEPSPAASPDVPTMKALPIPPPSVEAIQRMAEEGRAAECVDALKQMARTEGAGEAAVKPLETLLDRVKEDLKDTDALSMGELEAGRATCEWVLEAVAVCLPKDHEKKPRLTAKALNRRGDSLLALGEADEALADYETALRFTPDDAYILYNRGRAHQMMNHPEEAKRDFTEAANVKFNQPGARKLALEALKELDGPPPSVKATQGID